MENDLPKLEREELLWTQWTPVGVPHGILQIVHGMAEHIDRYEAFAKFMTRQGFLVVGRNHPGHGPEAVPKKQGDFGPRGWNGVVQETGKVSEQLKTLYPELPLFLLGHSMGSFVVRCLIHVKKFPYAGVILMGTGELSKSEYLQAAAALRIEGMVLGSRSPSQLAHRIQQVQYQARIPKGSLGNWLSSDSQLVQQFKDDPACGFPFPIQSYLEMVQGIRWAIEMEKRGQKLSYPVLVTSGEEDPVGHWGKDPRFVFERYRQLGADGTDCKIYPNLRHEILNEVHRDQVYQDLYEWMIQQMRGTNG